MSGNPTTWSQLTGPNLSILSASNPDRIPVVDVSASGAAQEKVMYPGDLFNGLTGAIDVASYATGGAGTSGSPWTGWDTAITWTASTRYHFRSGYFSYSSSPNFALNGIQLIGSAGTVFKHTGSGVGFNMDAGGSSSVASINTTADTITVSASFVGLAENAPVSFGIESGGTLPGGVTAGATYYVKGLSSLTFQISTSAGGAAVNLTGSVASCVCSSSNWVSVPVTVSDIIMLGNASTTDGFFMRGMRNGTFRNLSIQGCSECGFRSQACVTNILQNFNCTKWEGPGNAFVVVPKNGIIFEERGSSNHGTTTWTVINAVIEGVSEEGIWLKAGTNGRVGTYGNTFINGTTEENIGATQAGVRCAGRHNCFINFDSEANASSLDFFIEGDGNNFDQCTSSNLFKVNGSYNILSGGQIPTLTLTTTGGSCYANLLMGMNLTTLTDGGTLTKYLPYSSTVQRVKIGAVAAAYKSDWDFNSGSLDCNLYNKFKADGNNGAKTISAPSNAAYGDTIRLLVYANGGDLTLTWNGAFNWSYCKFARPDTLTSGDFLIADFEYSSTLGGAWTCVAMTQKHWTPRDGSNFVLGSTTGTKIGTATGQKLGFWNATPVVQQVLATGAAHTVDDVITFLQTIGLCKQS